MLNTPYLKLKVLQVLADQTDGEYTSPAEIADIINNSNTHNSAITRSHNILQQMSSYRNQGLVHAKKFDTHNKHKASRYRITPKGLLRLSFLLESNNTPKANS